jgi:hypothetical protein
MAPKSIKEENQRTVFTEEDDLLILKVIPKFMLKTGKTPYYLDFHTFVKKKVHGKISFKQLNRKIRGFKTKYGKEGNTFTKTHEKKALKLFKNIDWDTKGGSKSGSKSAKKENQVAQLKMCIDRAKFIKDQAILMIQELENSDD